MATDKRNRRGERTRADLHRALLSLVVERPYSEIVVRDILERARVGRTTFYAYFRDKDDLLLSGMDPLRESLLQCVRAKTAPHEPLRFVREFFLQGQAYLEPYRSLSGAARGNAERRLTAMLVEAAREEFKTRAGFRRPRAATDPVAYGVAGAVMGLVNWWTEQDVRIAVDDLYSMFHRLVAPGFRESLRNPAAVGARAFI